jgi:hypothetical protein
MSKPAIHGRNVTLSASRILEALADDLRQIREEDGLTFKELGQVLGKSEDQAAKYCVGAADMGVVSYAFAKRAWNGRFAGSLNRLISQARGDQMDDREKGSAVLRAALALSVALEDGTIDSEEVRRDRATLENAKHAIEAVLAKLTPRAA